MEVLPIYRGMCKYFIDSTNVHGYCFLKAITIRDELNPGDCLDCSKFDDSVKSEYLQQQINKRTKWLR